MWIPTQKHIAFLLVIFLCSDLLRFRFKNWKVIVSDIFRKWIEFFFYRVYLGFRLNLVKIRLKIILRSHLATLDVSNLFLGSCSRAEGKIGLRLNKQSNQVIKLVNNSDTHCTILFFHLNYFVLIFIFLYATTINHIMLNKIWSQSYERKFCSEN